MESLGGHLLIAAPTLTDPNFSKSAILIVDHDEDGAVGIVLNHPSESSIEFEPRITEHDAPSKQPLFIGGPEPGPLLVIHTQRSLSEIEILPGVYLSTQDEKVSQLVVQNHSPCRFFVGCAVWARGQLEQELASNAWICAPATFESVFCEEGDLWNDVVGAILTAAIAHSLGITHVPDDPSVN